MSRLIISSTGIEIDNSSITGDPEVPSSNFIFPLGGGGFPYGGLAKNTIDAEFIVNTKAGDILIWGPNDSNTARIPGVSPRLIISALTAGDGYTRELVLRGDPITIDGPVSFAQALNSFTMAPGASIEVMADGEAGGRLKGARLEGDVVAGLSIVCGTVDEGQSFGGDLKCTFIDVTQAPVATRILKANASTDTPSAPEVPAGYLKIEVGGVVRYLAFVA